ncbi:DUF63 family protein [Natronomonas aquatica]|uniref:DUF63 family protein n=1 Tax=Natronomonas aquatica TaxID=2841590 RepID=UPI0021097C98
MILPAGFGLPPLPYLLALAAGTVAAIGALYVRRPPVTAATVTALAPWMAAGGALYALYQAGAVPDPAAPLFGSPAVYVTVGILAGFVWALLAERPGESWRPTEASTILAAVGCSLLTVALIAAAVTRTSNAVGARALLSGAILLVSLVGGTLIWITLRRVTDVSATGTVGAVVVFGHTLDGVSTAVGYGMLGFGEQTPLSRLVIEAGGALPVPELLGGAWLFVLVKTVLGAAIVVLFEEYVREEPTEGCLLLGLIAAVGLGPGFHNVVLFAIS